jgi:hypothetical protein
VKIIFNHINFKTKSDYSNTRQEDKTFGGTLHLQFIQILLIAH